MRQQVVSGFGVANPNILIIVLILTLIRNNNITQSLTLNQLFALNLTRAPRLI